MSLERPNTEQLNAATPQELALLAADCMSRLEPGRQPLELFTQMARIATLPTFEAVPFNAASKDVEVLLGQRPDDDPWWPGQLHLPGNAILPQKKGEPKITFVALADGVLRKEFGGTVARAGDIHVFDVKPRGGPESRGSELTAFAWMNVGRIATASAVAGGDFFNVKDVLADPKEVNLLEGHEQTLAIALRSYACYNRLPRRFFRTAIGLLPGGSNAGTQNLLETL